jgi:hypothetical protein
MEGEDFKVQGKKKNDNNHNVKKMWKIIAQRPSDFDMQIVDALKNTIYDIIEKNKISQTKYGCYGDLIYNKIHDLIINFKDKDNKNVNFLIKNNRKDTGKDTGKDKLEIVIKDSKKLKKADIIRIEATIKKINEKILVILNSFNQSHFIIPPESVIYSEILEIRALGFIYMAWFILKHKSKFLSNDNPDSPDNNIIFPYSIIVSFQRFLNICRGYVGYNAVKPDEVGEISTLLIADLDYLEKHIIEEYKFNGISLYEKASELILGSQFDNYLPKKVREAFHHQILVSQLLSQQEWLKQLLRISFGW